MDIWNDHKIEIGALFLILVLANQTLLCTWQGIGLLAMAIVLIFLGAFMDEHNFWPQVAFALVAGALFLQTHQYASYSETNIVSHGQSLQVFNQANEFGETYYLFEVYEKRGFFYRKLNNETIRYTTRSDTNSRQVFKIIWPKLRKEYHENGLDIYR
ncbi:hypothetical protein [Lacticaseibacillus paracasei]|uniref:hypothetical protein n=1 Tax=Lacticaseibacillus paracasei TaxID=1597 RepID=UPI0003102763